MKNTLPRVLVSSVDVWNTSSGSDTFTNLLSGYDPEKIANIYIRSGKPTSEVCNKYFYISENAVIKSIFNRNMKTGMCVKCETEMDVDSSIEAEQQKEKKRYAFFTKHRLWVFLFAREILWKIGHWKSTELEDFIRDYNPEVLFFPIESYIHFNRINEYLVKKLGIPAVGIIWDDNFSYKVNRKNLGFLLHRYFLRKSVQRNISYCKKVFAISPKMQKECREVFGIEAELLTKGAKIEKSKTLHCEKAELPLKMVYTGKLNLGRIDTVELLANVLGEINKEQIQIELDIYSGTVLHEKEKNRLNKPGVEFRGHVTQDKIANIQEGADILLMVEALEGQHKYAARLSFSTKIVDYLAKGKCIMAVGPQDIASMEYLEENDAALIATSKQELYDVMIEILNNLDVLSEYGKKAFELVLSNHDLEKIQLCLYSSFLEQRGNKDEFITN